MALSWRPCRVRGAFRLHSWGHFHTFSVKPGIISNALRIPLRPLRLAAGGRSEERGQGMSLLKLNWGIAGLLVLVFPGPAWAGQSQQP